MRELDFDRRTQILSSGIIIRQDFRDCARMVFFDTDSNDWSYATHGGTAFIVVFHGQPYAFTCRHVFGDFNWRELIITDTKFGSLIVKPQSIDYPTEPRGEAEGSDIPDLAVIKFPPHIAPDFFKDTAYIFDPATVRTSKPEDALLVTGVLKEKSWIDQERQEVTIAPQFCFLEFIDVGTSNNDITLRQAKAQFHEPEFSSVDGLSGAPVYNKSTNVLCGMVVRAGINDNECRISYIDVSDMMPLLECVHENRAETYYYKKVMIPR